MSKVFKKDWTLFAAVMLLLLCYGTAMVVKGTGNQVWWEAGLGGLLVWSGIYAGIAGRGGWPRRILRMATAVLVLVGGVRLVESGWQVQNFLEHGLVMGAPMVLAMRWSERGREAAVQLALFLSAATFLGHGIYAAGFGIAQTKFVEITVSLLDTSRENADLFLKVVGALDVLAAILLMVGRWFKAALWYMVVWGLITAVARLVFLINGNYLWASMGMGLVAMGFRLVHGLVPLWMLWGGKWDREEEKEGDPREGA